MPLYPEKIAERFEERKDDLRSESIGDVSLIEDYTQVMKNLDQRFSRTELESRLKKHKYPGAVPSREFDDQEGPVVPFEESSEWGSHEAVNRWAKDILRGVTTAGVDGSQIGPTPEFNRPIGMVQAVKIINHHEEGGSYDRGVKSEILTTADMLTEEDDSEFVKLDEQEVHVRRFEAETELIREEIEEYGGAEKPPVLFYDGSLLIWFITHLDISKKERYGRAMGKLLGASKRYKVPVVGYVGGSNATELKNMIQCLNLINQPEQFLIRDHEFVSPLMENWGDRTVLYNSLETETLTRLKARYDGMEYDFSEDIMFTYLKTADGPQLDRIEMPRWIFEEGMLDHTMDVVRAECAVGRGFPEVLQQADADAVISAEDRKRFLRMYQEFSEENDIELRWNNKSRTKKRRRR